MIRKVFCAATLCAIYAASFSAQAISQRSEPPAQQSTDKAVARTQERTQQQQAPEKSPAKGAEKLPAQIELLETHVRFESNGDSRKEVHARVHINDELGARQFARLNFNYNRAFQSVEIPLAHITHANGGTSDVLLSAITDNPDPAVADFPAYQDVRVKSIRILGLAPADIFEYRVITTTTHHPLAPDFWFEHTFDRSGVTSEQSFDLDVPDRDAHCADKPNDNSMFCFNPDIPLTETSKSGEGSSARVAYHWDLKGPIKGADANPPDNQVPDVVYSTYAAWLLLSIRLSEKLLPGAASIERLQTYEEETKEMSRRPYAAPSVERKAAEVASASTTPKAKLEALYDFVSEKIKTVDIPLGATGFAARDAEEVMKSGYATQEDKFVLLSALASALKLSTQAGLTGHCDEARKEPPRPSPFARLLVSAFDGKQSYWTDPALEVAPFALIPPNSGSCVFVLNRMFFALNSAGHEWQKLDSAPPFMARQDVRIDASIAADGTLNAHAKYVMRGENELLLRVAFHQSPREKWDGVAQLLAVSDGFRGKISKTVASDPYNTHDAFSVSYEIAQQKFLDWSKKPVRMPALLPLLGLPEAAASPVGGGVPSPIELGTPLDVEVSTTVHLPAGTGAEVPAGTSIQRDFATYESHYAVSNATLTASRHINFILKEIPADRAAEYNAFLHAVQNDESQLFTLQPPDSLSQPKPEKK